MQRGVDDYHERQQQENERYDSVKCNFSALFLWDVLCNCLAYSKRNKVKDDCYQDCDPNGSVLVIFCLDNGTGHNAGDNATYCPYVVYPVEYVQSAFSGLKASW